jgi:hypothetical protein
MNQQANITVAGARRLPSIIANPIAGGIRRWGGAALAVPGLWLGPIFFLALPAVAQLATNDLPALAPPAAPIPPTLWEQHEVGIVIGGLAFLVLGSLVIWSLMRPAAVIVIPPGQAARAALAELAGQPEDGRLLSNVSRILRHYLVAVFGLPPEEVTTAEFCAQLAAGDRVGGELAEKFSRFLRECDRRKFSPEPSSPALNPVNQALELVALAEVRRNALAPAVPPETLQPAR